MLLTDITHRQTKEAIIKYEITDAMIEAFPDKQALRRYINQQSIKACHSVKKYHLEKYNIDMNYTNNMKEVKRNEGREKALLRKLSNV